MNLYFSFGKLFINRKSQSMIWLIIIGAVLTVIVLSKALLKRYQNAKIIQEMQRAIDSNNEVAFKNAAKKLENLSPKRQHKIRLIIISRSKNNAPSFVKEMHLNVKERLLNTIEKKK